VVHVLVKHREITIKKIKNQLFEVEIILEVISTPRLDDLRMQTLTHKLPKENDCRRMRCKTSPPLAGPTPKAYQPGSLPGLQKCLILGWASHLDAFSAYPFQT